MPSVQRYLPGHLNRARAATLAATSVRASTAIERTHASRAGGGRVRLGGSYTGHEATAVEVQLLAAGGTPRASVPQFVGVGNGALEVSAVAPGAALQSMTFTLADLGTATATAGLDVREVRIAARNPGAVGNSLRLTVTPALVRSPQNKSLLADWPAGQATQEGEQWDFGALPLSAKGELDAASPRLQFGTDPQVYRQWREFKDGAWRFGFSPALARGLSRGDAVFSVTGGYSVAVTDGAATESYPGLVTFFDLLTALAASALVQVAGVVAADRTVGGQAAIDVPLRTSAWLLATGGAVALEDVVVPSGAPTQAVTVRCANADVVGRERWQVVGDVSGQLPLALTGERYTHAAIEFLIPAKAAPQQGGDWSFTFEPAQRKEAEGAPSVCLRPFKLGANAAPKRVQFVYKPRPPADCDCRTVPAPRLSDVCLGLSQEGSDMSLEPAYQTRLEALYSWRSDFFDSNTALAQAQNGFGYIASDAREVEIANGVAGELARALAEIYEVPAAADQWDVELARVITMMTPLEGVASAGNAPIGRTAVRWGTTPAINQGQWVSPVVQNGRMFQAVTLGQTDTTEPDWDAALPIVDNYVVYGSSYTYWTSGETVAKGKRIEPGDGRVYVATTGGVSGIYCPIFSGSSAPVEDGTVVWQWVAASSSEIHVSGDVSVELLSAGTDYSAWALIRRGAGFEIFEPSRFTQSVVAANNVPPMAPVSAVVDMVAARMDYVRTLAGIVPKSEASGSDAGSCWLDPGDAMWWVDPTGRYLPAFTNQPYISARRDPDTGKPVSTKEFGFGLLVACPERLKIGDSISIEILNVDSRRPYNVGDEAIVQTVGAGPAWLTGGIDGDDRQTWRVVGSSSGALPNYLVPTDGTPAADYAQAGVTARLALGGIPFALGDQFSLSVEAGQYQWRRDGGAWSAAADIPVSGAAALPDGLQLTFEPGAAPSFVPGDAYIFKAHQPHAVSHVQDAQATAWAWAGAAATLEIDLGAVQPVGAVALARYQLPAGATVQAELSADGIAWTSYLLDWSAGVCVQAVGESARFVRLQIAGAAGGSIGHVWAGEPLTTTHHATSVQRRRRWAVTRGDGPNAAGLYAGAGDGWALAWQDCLTQQDASALLGMVDFSQQHDEPLIFVPHYQHSKDAALVRCTPQALEVSDVFDYQPDNAQRRLLSASLDLEPVYVA